MMAASKGTTEPPPSEYLYPKAVRVDVAGLRPAESVAGGHGDPLRVPGKDD
jgi:hypothetical protein